MPTPIDMNMNKYSQKDGASRGVRQAQKPTYEDLEAFILKQANEILRLKRKLNGIGGNDA